MTGDFTYKTPPLIEVIAEVRWGLIPLESVGGAIDPHFSPVSKKLLENLSARGFVDVERLVPEQVPLEVLANQPIFRVRRKKNTWPLFQIGPGVFTCNIVPPYKGWAEFRESLILGFEAFISAISDYTNVIDLNFLELRYIDGFNEEQGMNDYMSFLVDELGINLTVNDAMFSGDNKVVKLTSASGELVFDNVQPEKSKSIIRYGKGTKDKREALIAQLRVISDQTKFEPEQEALLSWFDSAHFTVRHLFLSMISERIDALMGPKSPVEDI